MNIQTNEHTNFFINKFVQEMSEFMKEEGWGEEEIGNVIDDNIDDFLYENLGNLLQNESTKQRIVELLTK